MFNTPIRHASQPFEKPLLYDRSPASTSADPHDGLRHSQPVRYGCVLHAFYSVHLFLAVLHAYHLPLPHQAGQHYFRPSVSLQTPREPEFVMFGQRPVKYLSYFKISIFSYCAHGLISHWERGVPRRSGECSSFYHTPFVKAPYATA